MENISSGFESLLTDLVLIKTKREQYLDWYVRFFRNSMSLTPSLHLVITDRAACMRTYPQR